MNVEELVSEFDGLNDGYGLEPHHVDQIVAEIQSRRARGEAIDVSEYLGFGHRITRAEKRLEAVLPNDVRVHLEENSGMHVDDGMGVWLGPESLYYASECDPYDFMLADDRPELLCRDDLKHMVTLTNMDGCHLLVDLRDGGKGVFPIWEDDIDIQLHAKTLTVFLDRFGKFREDWEMAVLD